MVKNCHYSDLLLKGNPRPRLTSRGQCHTTDSVDLLIQCRELAVSFIVGGTSSNSTHVGVLAGCIYSHVEDWIVVVAISIDILNHP